jgi:hypothetical protein
MSEEFVNIYRTELRAGQPVGREEIVVGKHGQRYWAKVISNPILDADGRWQYTVSMLTDITRSKMHEACSTACWKPWRASGRWWRCWRWCARRSSALPRSDGIDSGSGCPGPDPLAGQACRVLFAAARRRGHRPKVGSCGTAAWRNAPVLVDDIAQDPLWSISST